MKILRDPMSHKGTPSVVVLGMFDGVHRGHQALIGAGKTWSHRLQIPLTVCTFEPHPLRYVKPDQAPPLLTTLPERARLMAHYGVDQLSVFSFNQSMADIAPEDFLRLLQQAFAPKVIVCGFNFTFGKGGAGTGETIAAYCRNNGMEAVIVPEVMAEGKTISSTRIRALIAQGDDQGATRLMGHPYTMTGTVVAGKALGRTMGFPTANVAVSPKKQLPAFGVHACYLEVDRDFYFAVVNVGRHPTLPDGGVTVEAHVLDEQLDLYGKKVRLTFLNHQRDERQFASKEELQSQIALDAQAARTFLQKAVEQMLSTN